MNYPKDKILKKKIDTEKSKDFSYGSIILIWFMKERYLIIKKLYKDYVILIKDKNNRYNELYLKVKLIELLEDLCKRELE